MVTVYRSDRATAGLVLAHGAGSGQQSRFMIDAGRAFAARGITTATFDFPYIVAGRKVPDKAPVLEAAWRDAVAEVRTHEAFAGLPPDSLFIGGKSMGGRMASHVAAQDGTIAKAVIFLGYPLHPPGRPEQRRDAHLPAITLPMLFVQGSRDQFGTAADIRALLPRLNPRAELFEVVDGDHSFKVRVSVAGLKQPAVFDAIFDAVTAFIARWSAPPAAAPAP